AATQTISDNTSRISPRHSPTMIETSRMGTITQSAPFNADMPASAAVGDDHAVEPLAGLQFLLLRLGFGAPHVGADAHRPALAAALDEGRITGAAQALAQLRGIGLVGEGTDLHRPGAGATDGA